MSDPRERLYRCVIVAFALAIAVLACVESRGEWFKYAPTGAVDGQGIYKETMSRCPEWMAKQIRTADKATQCHEATHGVDYEISRLYKQEYGAFYVGDGRCCVLSEPNVTIGQVARYVPQDQRTGRFKTYLTGDRVSRNCLSILDELSCYANDATCTRDMKLRDDGGLEFAQEFIGFADCLIQAVKDRDPKYAQLKELVAFVEWQADRVAKIAGSKPAKADGDFMADIPVEWRERNRASSCVHMSTAHELRYMGLFEDADDWLATHRGGEDPYSHKRQLDRANLQYGMTTDADEEFLEYCIANRLMVGVTTKPSHCLNLVGRVTDADGRQWAVLLDNNRPKEYEYELWDSWYRKYKRSGWAFTITSGEVPPPTPST